MDGNLEIVKPYLWIGFDPNLLWECQTIPLNWIWSQSPLRVSNHTSELDLIPISSNSVKPYLWIKFDPNLLRVSNHTSELDLIPISSERLSNNSMLWFLIQLKTHLLFCLINLILLLIFFSVFSGYMLTPLSYKFC